MSTPAPTNESLCFLIEDHLPQSNWTLGGGLRFDSHILALINYLNKFLPVRTIDTVAAIPPCAWSLDWHSQRRPDSWGNYTNMLESYAKSNTGVALVFDNPFISEDMLDDKYILALVTELYQRDRVRKNSVVVANDTVRDLIRAQFPNLPIQCHQNRIIAEQGKRTTALYNQLAEQYNQVTLHPADAVKPSITQGLKNKERFNIITNDPELRNCAVRRDMLRLLADWRKNPYNMETVARKRELIARSGCELIHADKRVQKAIGNLTLAEKQSLCEQGFRNFIVQSQPFRNEMTVLWDFMRQIYTTKPEYSNKVALIHSAIAAEMNARKAQLISGLSNFQFLQPE